MIPKLTKEEAIREHRKMWNWIAEQYESSMKMEGIAKLIN